MISTLSSVVAFAHPSFSQNENNRYIKLTAMTDRVRLAYTILYGPLPAVLARRQADANGDQRIDAREGDAFAAGRAAAVTEQLRVEIDGAAVPVDFVDVIAGLDDGLVTTAPFAVDLVAYLPVAAGRQVAHKVTFDDRSELDRLGETELLIEEAADVRLVSSSRGSLQPTLETQFKFRGVRRPDEPSRQIFFVFEQGTGHSAAPTGDESMLVRLFTRGHVGQVSLFWIAYVLGALHALGPGHGKSVVASYLVGSRATTAHAAALGGILTVTHIGSVVVVGLLALWATEYFMPDRIGAWLELAAGVAITILGVTLLYRRLRRSRANVQHHHTHGHDHDHDHASHADLPHHHPGSHDGAAAMEAPRTSALFTLGLSAGIIPCPPAIAILLSAIASRRIAFGLGLILLFSLGLASVLVAIGIATVRARALLSRFDAHGTIARRAPIVSAALVTLVGIAMTLESLLHHLS